MESDMVLAVLASMIHGYLFIQLLQYTLILLNDQTTRTMPTCIPDVPPKVTICIPACNESTDILDQTLFALRRIIRYPNYRIVLLENSESKESFADIDSLCRMYECELIDLPFLGNKAKILNVFLERYVDSPYVLFIDADQVAEKDILSDLMPLLVGGACIVQTPQFSRNASENILTKMYAGKQYIFYQLVCSAKSDAGCALCLGSNFIASVDILRALGGFDSASITEDIAISIDLDAAGHSVVYVNARYFSGLAPSSLRAYFAQQIRYCSGNLALIGKYFRLIVLNRNVSLSKKLGYFQIFSGHLTPLCLALDLLLFRQSGAIFVTLVNALLILVVFTKHRNSVSDWVLGTILYYASFPVFIASIPKLCSSLEQRSLFFTTPKSIQGRTKRETH